MLHAVFGQWLPLSRAVMDMVCDVLPSPEALGTLRVRTLMYGTNSPATFPPVSTIGVPQCTDSFTIPCYAIYLPGSPPPRMPPPPQLTFACSP